MLHRSLLMFEHKLRNSVRCTITLPTLSPTSTFPVYRFTDYIELGSSYPLRTQIEIFFRELNFQNAIALSRATTILKGVLPRFSTS